MLMSAYCMYCQLSCLLLSTTVNTTHDNRSTVFLKMRSIPVDKLRELSRYLDEFPTLMPGDGDVEYWRLLIQQLPRRMYSKAQVEEFARELETPSGSPSLRLLYDMREKGVTLEQFKVHLETIRCHKALNIFTPTSK